MAVTTPDNIWTPDAGDAYALTTDLAAMADTVQDAITSVRDGASFRSGTNAERLALSGPELFDGLTWYTTDTQITWNRYLGAWVREFAPFATAAGRVAAVAVGAGAVTTTAVTFPAGRFSVPPVVMVTQTGVGFRDINVGAENVTTSGFTLWRGSNSVVTRSPQAEWVAFQMFPGAATG